MVAFSPRASCVGPRRVQPSPGRRKTHGRSNEAPAESQQKGGARRRHDWTVRRLVSCCATRHLMNQLRTPARTQGEISSLVLAGILHLLPSRFLEVDSRVWKAGWRCNLIREADRVRGKVGREARQLARHNRVTSIAGRSSSTIRSHWSW